MRKTHIRTLASLIAGFAGSAVLAQSGNLGLEEVIVTAQKREQNLQDVPVSVSVLQGGDLAERGLQSVSEIYTHVPGLQYTPSTHGGSNANFYIRGIGQVDFISTVEPGVGVYIDGVYVARTVGAGLDLLDIDRIEVLRGPQGTLFGKNTIGGAVNVVTKAPHFNEYEGQVRLRVGERNRMDGALTANIPIIDDTLALRASFTSQNQDGYGKSLFDGRDRSDEATNAGRVSVLWRASDRLDVQASVDVTITRESEKHSWPLSINSNSFITAAQNAFAIANGIEPFDDRWLTTDIYTNNSGFSPGNDITAWGTHLQATFKVNDNINLRSITAFRDIHSESGLDFDTSPSEISDQSVYDDQHQVSQEFLLSGLALDERLDWLVGAFYMREKGVTDIQLRLAFAEAPFGVGTSRYNEYSSDSYALFSQMSYRLTDKLSIIGGVRYSIDEKKNTVENVNLKTGVPNLPRTTRDDSWSVPTYRLGLEYNWSDEVMTYASYATGYKSGGWNGRSSALNQFDSYAEEEVGTFEIGVKGDFLNRLVRANISAFYSDYTDIQATVNVRDPNTNAIHNVVQNAAAADIRGVELEVLAILGDHWRANLGTTWMDAKYSKLDPGVVLNVNHKLPQIPTWTFAAGLSYARPVSANGEVFFRADYYYKSDFHHNAQNSAYTLEPAYALTDLRLGYHAISKQWKVTAYAKNLFNEKYMLFREDVSAFTVAIGIPAPPRELGLEFQYTW